MRTRDPEAVRLPPKLENAEGEERCVGVEMEFGGMNLLEIAHRVSESIGGVVRSEGDYRALVEGTAVGTVRVEFDARLFSDLKLKGLLDRLPFANHPGQEVTGSLERLLASAAARFVPFELAFPPVPIRRLGELEAVREGLRLDAEGTAVSLFNAFGLHLNPEVPDFEPDTTLRCLRAFLCLYEDLKVAHRIDPSRALSPFIDPFPDEFSALVLEDSYRPDWPAFLADYLRFNPTRNRPLDLLPLFAHLDEKTVLGALPDAKISGRPTLHYRLPNCRIDEADWTISAEWNRYATIEELAFDDRALGGACLRELERIRDRN